MGANGNSSSNNFGATVAAKSNNHYMQSKIIQPAYTLPPQVDVMMQHAGEMMKKVSIQMEAYKAATNARRVEAER